MIDIKNCRLTLIMALATLLPSLTVADESYGSMFKRWGRNAWNTSYPVATQVGALGLTAILSNNPGLLGGLIGSHYLQLGGLLGSPMLAHYLQSRQYPYSSAPNTSWSSYITHPTVVQTVAVPALLYLLRRGDVSYSSLGKAAAAGAVTGGLGSTWYNQ